MALTRLTISTPSKRRPAPVRIVDACGGTPISWFCVVAMLRLGSAWVRREVYQAQGRN
jgi:hypothetical protein